MLRSLKSGNTVKFKKVVNNIPHEIEAYKPHDEITSDVLERPFNQVANNLETILRALAKTGVKIDK